MMREFLTHATTILEAIVVAFIVIAHTTQQRTRLICIFILAVLGFGLTAMVFWAYVRGPLA